MRHSLVPTWLWCQTRNFCASVLRAKARGHRDVVTVVGHAATIAAGEWITASG